MGKPIQSHVSDRELHSHTVDSQCNLKETRFSFKLVGPPPRGMDCYATLFCLCSWFRPRFPHFSCPAQECRPFIFLPVGFSSGSVSWLHLLTSSFLWYTSPFFFFVWHFLAFIVNSEVKRWTGNGREGCITHNKDCQLDWNRRSWGYMACAVAIWLPRHSALPLSVLLLSKTIILCP